MSALFKHLAVRAWAIYEAAIILERGMRDATAQYGAVVRSYDAQFALGWPSWLFTGWRRYALSAALVFWGILELQQP